LKNFRAEQEQMVEYRNFAYKKIVDLVEFAAYGTPADLMSD